jgi:hypothetical protein
VQVVGAPGAVGREVLMAWLAAAAASNEVRTAGGEYGVLQHLNQGAWWCWCVCKQEGGGVPQVYEMCVGVPGVLFSATML